MIRTSKSYLRKNHSLQFKLFENFSNGSVSKYELYHKKEWDGGYLNNAGNFGEKADYLHDFKDIQAFLELYFEHDNIKDVICVPEYNNDFKDSFLYSEENEISRQAHRDFMKFMLDFHNCPAVKINVKTEKEILYNLISGAFNYLFKFGIFLDDMKNVIVPYHHMEFFFLNTDENIMLYENLIKQCNQCENLNVGLY